MSKEKILKLNTDLFEKTNIEESQYKYVDTLEVCGMNNKEFLDFIKDFDNIENIIIHNASNVIVDETLRNIKNQSNIKSLILDNVMIPRLKLIENMTNISMMSFNNIKDKRLYTFLRNYKNKSCLQYLSLENVELIDFSFSVIEKYMCLKTINLNNVDTKWEKIESLFKLKFVEKINIHIDNSDLEIISNLIKQLKLEKVPQYCTTTLKINCENKNSNFYNSIIYRNDGKVEARISTADLKKYISLIKFNDFDELVLYMNTNISFSQYLKTISKVSKIRIIIPNCSMLTTRKAEFLSQNLNISTVNIFDFDECIYSDTQKNNYEIKDYIQLRQYIDLYINNISFKTTKMEKFLTLYYRLGKDIVYTTKANKTRGDEFKHGIVNKECTSVGFALVLKNLLACMGIKSNLILGKLGRKTIMWNQVEIDRKWYNVDIANDSTIIKTRRKAKYCLLSNSDMEETHIFTTLSTMKCNTTYNNKVINRYFRYGRIIDYRGRIAKILKRIKLVINSNNVKRLPEGKEG